MKLAFIAGGLEPGTNGVGDYSRLLAEEIIRMRRSEDCGLIALNDPAVQTAVAQPVIVSVPGASDLKIPQLRLPSSMPWAERVTLAKQFLDDMSVDWISFQFVPHAYDPKGFVNNLPARLAPLIQDRRVQVMFHELWMGEGQGVPWKQRVVGKLQRQQVLGLVRSLRPSVSNTSNLTYLRRLEKAGVKASLLPLFGNIPVVQSPADSWLFPMLQEQGIAISPETRSQYWLFGFFGSLRGRFATEPLFPSILEAAKRTNRKVVVLSAGRHGNTGRWDEIAAKYSGVIPFVSLGEQSPERVSQYLNSLDAGFAISHLSLLGKSGVVAAMFDHGLPVLVNTIDVPLDPAYGRRGAENLLIPVDGALAERLVAGLPRQPAEPTLTQVATQLLGSLGHPAPLNS